MQEETFYVLDGECEWRVGDQRVSVPLPEPILFLPPGVPHNITNVSDKPARVLMTVSPPGHEHYFRGACESSPRAVAGRIPRRLPNCAPRYDTDQLSALEHRQAASPVPAGQS